MKRHHMIISGTGRNGTTFLMQLFTQLEMDTGFYYLYDSIDFKINAGMEGFNILDEDSPYIIKSPFFCDNLEEVILEENIIIDYAIVPIRDLHSAAQSRIVLGDGVTGGLFGTRNPRKQKSALGVKLYNLIYILTKYDIPTTLLLFPRIVFDKEYLYSKLKFIFDKEKIDYKIFSGAFRMASEPTFVHKYE